MSLSRRQRRSIAKSMGLLGQEKTVEQILQRARRANEFGKQLHTRHLEGVMNEQLETLRMKKIQMEEDTILMNNNENSSENESTNKESFSFLSVKTPAGSDTNVDDFSFPQNNG